ncbi:hypothetical protein QJQ45_022832 [Haematococcus lacustris]|nr:hypothetical protein QJQ45_022832 [Haematococcus lacustris]
MNAYHAGSPSWSTVLGLSLTGLGIAAAYVAFCPHDRYKYRKIPGPVGLPFLGNLLSMVGPGKDTTTMMQACQRRYGSVFKASTYTTETSFGFACLELDAVTGAGVAWRVTAGLVWVPVLGGGGRARWGAARRLMSRALVRPSIKIMALLDGESQPMMDLSLLGAKPFSTLWLPARRGPAWRVARKAFEAALMHRDSLALHLEVMEQVSGQRPDLAALLLTWHLQCVARLIARLARATAAADSSGAIVDVAPLMGDLTMDVVGSCVFGVAFNTQEAEEGGAAGAAGDLGLPFTAQELVAACRALFDSGKVDQASRWVMVALLLPEGMYEVIRGQPCTGSGEATPGHHWRCLGQYVGSSHFLCQLEPTDLLLCQALSLHWGGHDERCRWLACRFPDAGQLATLHSRKVIVDMSKALIQAWEQDKQAAQAFTGTAASALAGSGASDQGPAPAAARVNAKSFLAQLLQGQDLSTGDSLTQQQVIAQVFIFLIAGYETTATTLTFALYLLAVNPEAQRKLQEEVDGQAQLLSATSAPSAAHTLQGDKPKQSNGPTATSGQGRGSTVSLQASAHSGPGTCPCGPAWLPGVALSSEELAHSFPYACAVVDEALRLYPPGANAIRSLPEEVEVAGYKIPANSFVYLPIYSFHHATDAWPDADQFRLERHMPGHPDAMDAASKANYMPFGHGARWCPGSRFALQEARLALVRLVRHFAFELAPQQEHPVRTRTGLTMAPIHGMTLRVHSRAEAAT